MPFTFFSKNRALYALFLLTVVENILLVDLMKRNNKSYLFYFFPFENDANFSALLLMKNNIKVHKVPGPNSLFHNHNISSEYLKVSPKFRFRRSPQHTSAFRTMPYTLSVYGSASATPIILLVGSVCLWRSTLPYTIFNTLLIIYNVIIVDRNSPY